jgi:hypothetical protein
MARSDETNVRAHVGERVQSRRVVLKLSFVEFDPFRTSNVNP